MKKTKLLILSSALFFSSSALADYYSYDYESVDYAQTKSTSQGYMTLSGGSYFTDLDDQGASASIGYHHQYDNNLYRPGWGVKLTSSVSSSISEDAGSNGQDLSLRYGALTGYLSSQYNIYDFSPETSLSLELRGGVSATKLSGDIPSGLSEDIDFGIFYGAGLIYDTNYDFQTFINVDGHDSISTYEVHGGIRIIY